MNATTPDRHQLRHSRPHSSNPPQEHTRQTSYHQHHHQNTPSATMPTAQRYDDGPIRELRRRQKWWRRKDRLGVGAVVVTVLAIMSGCYWKSWTYQSSTISVGSSPSFTTRAPTVHVPHNLQSWDHTMVQVDVNDNCRLRMKMYELHLLAWPDALQVFDVSVPDPSSFEPLEDMEMWDIVASGNYTDWELNYVRNIIELEKKRRELLERPFDRGSNLYHSAWRPEIVTASDGCNVYVRAFYSALGTCHALVKDEATLDRLLKQDSVVAEEDTGKLLCKEPENENDRLRLNELLDAIRLQVPGM